jgi:D-3-phosphoglycerate dehydrogenase
MRIVILDDYQDVVRTLDAYSMLAGHDVTIYNDTVTALDALAARLEAAEAAVLIRERTPITDQLLARLPRLKLISQTGSGVAHVDVDACSRHGVVVSVGTSAQQAPAELTWAMIMASSRHLPAYGSELKNGRWQSAAGLGLGRVLQGRRLGIWSYGRIGRIVAGYGRAFGMDVRIWGSEASRMAALRDGFAAAESKEQLFAECDVVSIHLRLVDATRGIITESDLARMKPDALFVNTSRAELLDPGALERSLSGGNPGFAAIDVFENEPVTDPGHPLVTRTNVLATPHIGFVEKDNYELYFGTAFENLIAFDAQMPRNVVNPEILRVPADNREIEASTLRG